MWFCQEDFIGKYASASSFRLYIEPIILPMISLCACIVMNFTVSSALNEACTGNKYYLSIAFIIKPILGSY